MKEIIDILEAYKKIDLKNERAALATVIRVEGSSYRRTGARMLIRENGQWTGGISGGCLEGDALRRAKMAMVKNQASVVTYDTTQEDGHQIGVGLGCNGIIDVLLSPLSPSAKHDPIALLQQCSEERKVHVLITLTNIELESSDLNAGDMFHFYNSENKITDFPSSDLQQLIIPDIKAVWQKQKSAPVEYQSEQYGKVCFFIEYLPPPIHLVLCGGQYDIYPMAELAQAIGWKISVVANPTKLNRSIFQTAKKVISKKTDWLTTVQPDPHTALVLMAHDYATDMRNLATSIVSEVPYIGILGPRKRYEKMEKELKSAGVVFTENINSRIYNPIGLDIGAKTPEEIAVAILAEVRAFFAGRKGGFLKERVGPIHEH